MCIRDRQVEDPAAAKGIVKREVIQIVTPGTVTSQSMLNEKENNYLASVYMDKRGMSISYCDISTGELYTTEETEGINVFEDVLNELVKIDAKEIMINQSFALKYDEDDIKAATGGFLFVMNDSYYSPKAAEDAIKAQFESVSLLSLIHIL